MKKCPKCNTPHVMVRLGKTEPNCGCETMEDIWEEQAYCPKCNTPHVMVRPGKTQPNCECDSLCGQCGNKLVMHYEGNPDPRYPRMFGEWCDVCGPFSVE